MKISVSFEFETPEGITKLVQEKEVIRVERGDLQLETLGLTITFPFPPCPGVSAPFRGVMQKSLISSFFRAVS